MMREAIFGTDSNDANGEADDEEDQEYEDEDENEDGYNDGSIPTASVRGRGLGLCW